MDNSTGPSLPSAEGAHRDNTNRFRDLVMETFRLEELTRCHRGNLNDARFARKDLYGEDTEFVHSAWR